MALGVNALLARLLDPAELGAFFVTQSLALVGAMVATLGLEGAVVRLVAEALTRGRPARVHGLVRAGLGLGVLGGGVVAAALALGAGAWLAEHLFRSPLLGQVSGLAGLWVLTIVLGRILTEAFRGFEDIRLTALFGGLLTSTITLVLFASVWVARGQSSLTEVVLLSAGAAAANVLIAAPLLARKIPARGRARIGLSRPLRELSTIAWPMLLANLTYFALTQSGLWIVSAFRTGEEVALYGAAYRLVTLIALPLAIVNVALAPLIVEKFRLGEADELERALRSAATTAGVLALLAFAGFVLAGDLALELVFGDFYGQATGALLILGVGQLAHVWAGSAGLLLNMTGNQVAAMIITAAAAAVTLGVALATVSRLGILGVALAYSAGLMIQNILSIGYARRAVGVKSYGGVRVVFWLRTTVEEVVGRAGRM